MSQSQFDVIIIGSGPGGYIAAIRASQLGLKTAIVEKNDLGGICLNWGCIPTKALLRSAEIFHYMQHAQDYGLKVDQARYDFKAVIKRSRGVSDQMKKGVGFLMKKNKVTLLEGEGSIHAPGTVEVKGKDGGTYSAKHIVVATGARPRELPGLERDGKFIWTYFEALAPDMMPKRLLVIGSGAIGIEFASFYRTMGADVTVVEMLDQVMPLEDTEISKAAEKRFKNQGMTILLESKVSSVTKGKDTITAHVEGKDGKMIDIEVDRLICAVGVLPNSQNLGLEQLGVKLDRGVVVADGYGQTNVKGIYAIGDVAGPPMLAHKAEHEAVICIEKIAGKHVHPMDKSLVPGCIYCHPQIASIGMTEKAAKQTGKKIKIGRFPFAGNGKAVALGEADGLIKTIFDEKTGQLLGAHMIGAEVTELIQGYVVAMNLETTEQELMHTIFPHPTLSEMMKESVLDAYGKALNM